MNNNNGLNIFQNSGYINQRNRKKTLILDVEDSDSGDTHLGGGTEFNIKLFEPLVIDKHSEVYLDNFLTFNSNIAQNISSCAYVLKINEFKMNSNIASPSDNDTIYGGLIIPNEHSSAEDNHGSIVHKGKKFNYVCDINPQTIHSLSGKITDLSGQPIFHGTSADNVYTYSLTGIESGNLNVKIDNNTQFTHITSGGGTTQTISGHFIVTHFTTTTTLHFSTKIPVTNLTNFKTAQGNITFTLAGAGTDPEITNTSGNPNLTLLQNAGRFIAEFSIISRE